MNRSDLVKRVLDFVNQGGSPSARISRSHASSALHAIELALRENGYEEAADFLDWEGPENPAEWLATLGARGGDQ